MRLISSALIGSAAALTATAGAMAADLPSRKAAPAAYVKICDVYGRGFYYIPGTNTCLKVGGRVRFEMDWRQASNTWIHDRAGGTFMNGARYDTLGWRARAYVNMDARTQTAWGTVQTVISIAIRSHSGVLNGSNPATGPFGQTTATPQVYAAYIRFAGFTVGRTRRIFQFMPSRMYGPQYWSSSSSGVVQLAYTATFGNGFSATIGLEDNNDYGYSVRATRLTTAFGTPAAAIFPTRIPMIVGNIRVDQGWGSAQVMAGWVANNYVVTVGGLPITGRKPGWGVGAGVRINLPSLARGDHFLFTAAYARGAHEFTHSRYINGTTSHGRLMGGMLVQGANTAIFFPAAGVLAAENGTSWSVGGVFVHYWMPSLRSNFAASYVSINPGAMQRSLDWYNAGGLGRHSAWTVAGNLIWSPTSGFDIGLEIGYRKANYSLTAVGPVWGSLAAPNTIGVSQNPSMVYTRLRVQRTF